MCPFLARTRFSVEHIVRSKVNQSWQKTKHFHASSTIQVLISSIMRLFFLVRSPSTFPAFLENMMCFNKRSSFPAEPLMLKQRVSNFHANRFLWTPRTKATLLFIYLSIFHHALGGKLGHRKAASSLVCHSGFPYCIFAISVHKKGVKKKKRERLFHASPFWSPFSVSLAEVAAMFFSYPV